MPFSFDKFMTGLSSGLAQNKGPIGGFGQGFTGAYNTMKGLANQEAEQNAVGKILSGDESGWTDWGKVNPQGAMNAWNQREQLNRYNEELALKKQDLANKYNRTTNMRDFEYFSGLTPEQQKQYLTLHKSGDTNISVSPLERKRVETFASKLDENISDAQERLTTAEKGLALLNKMETGGVKGYIMNASPDMWLSSDAQDFRSVQNKLIPQQRQAGSGTMSDADRDMYAKATISLTKDTQANKNILGLQKTVAENDLAYAQLKSMWVDQGGKTTEFDSMWRDYSNKNPIFTKEGGLNGNRADPYEWFSSGYVQETTITPEEAIAELKRRGRM